MSRRFRICMAREDRESLRPSYSRPKLTFISRKKITFGGVSKSNTAKIFKIQPCHCISSILIYICNTADSIARLNFENCRCIIFCIIAPILLAHCVLPPSPNFRQAKHGQKGHTSIFRQKTADSIWMPETLPIAILNRYILRK